MASQWKKINSILLQCVCVTEHPFNPDVAAVVVCDNNAEKAAKFHCLINCMNDS